MTNPVHVYESDFGVIDMTPFAHLKFRKDGWFDGRRSERYYRDAKQYIAQKESELVHACQSAWDDAKADIPGDKSEWRVVGCIVADSKYLP